MNPIITRTALPSKTATVSSAGAEYETIQAALNENAVENLIVLVYPGTYANDTINFTANSQCIVGVGSGAQQVVTNTAKICNAGAYTGCSIENMTLTGTYTSAIDMISGSGSLNVEGSYLNVASSGTIAGSATILNYTGTATFDHCTLTSANTAVSAGQIKRAVTVGTAANIAFKRCTITVTGSGASAAHSFNYGAGSGVTTIERCHCSIVDADASILAGYYSAGSGTTNIVYGNDFTITAGAAATAYGIFVSGTESMRSSYNRIYTVSSAGADYAFFVDTGCTLNSFFDDIDAGTAATTGAGTINYVSSLSDGSASATVSLTAPTVYGTTFDTNVAAAGVTLAGTTLAADGTDANIDISITPKGTGEVNITKVDIDSGTIDGATIATSNVTVGSGKTLDVSAGTLTLANDQISGDKVEGGTINATTINTLTSTTVNATTFDTNVAAAGVTLAGSTLAADGTDANINISITPKGTGEVNITKVDIDAGTIDGTTIGATSASTGIFTTVTADVGAVNSAAFRFSGDLNTGIFSTGADKMSFTTGGTAYMMADGVNNAVVVGPNISAALVTAGGSTFTPYLQTVGTAAGASTMVARFAVSATNGPAVIMARSVGSSVGDYTAVGLGTRLGSFQAIGSDGTDFSVSSAIRFESEGTIADNQVPGRIKFETVTTGATPTEAMRIDSAQQVSCKATTASTSTTTGGFVTSGGVGIAKEIVLTASSTGAVYWGPTGTDGSVRCYGNGSGALIFEKRASSAWTEIGRFG